MSVATSPLTVGAPLTDREREVARDASVLLVVTAADLGLARSPLAPVLLEAASGIWRACFAEDEDVPERTTPLPPL